MTNNEFMNRIDYGKRCRQMRLKHDLSQQQVAEALGVVRAYVSGVEKATLIPGRIFMLGIKEFYSKTHHDNKPLDWWAFGIDLNFDTSRKELLDLISRKDAEIDSLKKLCESLQEQIGLYKKIVT